MKLTLVFLAVCIGSLYGKQKSSSSPSQEVQFGAVAIGAMLCYIYDMNEDGIINDLPAIISDADRNGDARLSNIELSRRWMQKDPRLHRKWIHTLFDALDENGDGYLSLEDDVLKALGVPEGETLHIYDCIRICIQVYMQDPESLMKEINQQKRRGLNVYLPMTECSTGGGDDDD